MEVASLVVPWKPMKIMPVGDIQYDGPGGAAHLSRLRRHLEWGMEEGAWFLGTGDFIDFLSPSNRERLNQAALYDTASNTIDRAATNLETELLQIIGFTKGRWLGFIQGHHYFEHRSDGTTSDTRFAAALNARYLGDSCIYRLTFKEESGGAKNFKFYAHHGAGGGGVLPTAPLNKLLRMKPHYPDVRLFLMGHLPQLGHVVTDGVDVTDRGVPRLVHEDTHYVVTGSFARGYQEGSTFAGRAQGGYAEKRMMPPAVLGGAVILLTPEVKTREGVMIRSVDVKVMS